MLCDQFGRPKRPQNIDVENAATVLPICINQWFVNTNPGGRKTSMQLARCFDSVVKGILERLLIGYICLMVRGFDSITV